MVDSISNAYAAAQGATKLSYRASLTKPLPAPQRLLIAAHLMDFLCHESNDVRSILTAANILCGRQIDYWLISAQEYCEKAEHYGDDVAMTKLSLSEMKNYADDIHAIFSKDIFKDRAYAINARSICILLKKFIESSEESEINNAKEGAVMRNFTAINPFLMLGMASEVLGNIERRHQADTFSPLTEDQNYAPLNKVEEFVHKMRQFLSAQDEVARPSAQSLSTACAALERLAQAMDSFTSKLDKRHMAEYSDIACALGVLKDFTRPYNQPASLMPSRQAGELLSFADAMVRRGRTVVSQGVELAPAGG